MKKSLLGLFVATLAFFVGVFAAKIYLVKYQFVSAPPIEAVKVEEIKTVKPEISQPTKEIVSYQSSIYGNNYGWYSLDENNTMPEVSMISLSNQHIYNEDGTESGMVKSYAGIYTTLSEDIDEGFAEGVWVTVDNNVKFKTKKLKGIVYSFEGFFFKNKTSGENGEKVLRGTLQKYIKGKKVAQMSGDFAYYEPHCLH